ncbi:unnamed protein product [Cylindrotheca closterium]|uniref:Uncharacterized protein n=1 Tax=Cylindrotheca closterium TaxID=2856 RepID=A0AAD2JKP1_9STRA|nr:unnamed protein product [Cylindrotheca closterium]
MTGNAIILNSPEAIQIYLDRGPNQKEDIDTLAIDWLDLENDDIRNALHELFLGGPQHQDCGKRWSAVEVRKCMGTFTPMLIRWILQASVVSPIETLTLVSVVDNDVAMALQQSSFGQFPTADDDTEPTKKVPNIGRLEIWGSALSQFTIQLILRGIYGHASILSTSNTTMQTTAIHTLSLSNCNFLPDTVNRMAKELKVRSRTNDSNETMRTKTEDCSCLQRLNLFSCRLGDDEVATLVKALHRYKHPLKYLDLGKNRCHHATFRALGHWMTSPHCKLESLNLSLQQLGFGVHHWNPQLILDNLIPKNRNDMDDNEEHTPSLKALYLRGNPIDDGGDSSSVDGDETSSSSPFATSLVNVLTQNTTMEKVMLTDCSLSNDSYDVLLQHLHQFRGIRKLWLDGIQRYQKKRNAAFTRKIVNGLMGPKNNNVTLDEIHLPLRLIDLVLQTGTILDWNFGGRRLLLAEDSSAAKAIPCSLWPVVLERINQANLPKRLPPSRSNIQDRMKVDQSRRATILYSMIRENASLQHAIG